MTKFSYVVLFYRSTQFDGHLGQDPGQPPVSCIEHDSVSFRATKCRLLSHHWCGRFLIGAGAQGPFGVEISNQIGKELMIAANDAVQSESVLMKR